MIATAARKGQLTAPYVFDAVQANAVAKAGADILVPHVGLTTSGTIGASTALTPEDAVNSGPLTAPPYGGACRLAAGAHVDRLDG